MQRIIPYFAHHVEIRKVIYTTNAIELLNMVLREVTTNRGSVLNDEALLIPLPLALTNSSKKLNIPVKDRKSAQNQFSIMFEDRI